MSVRFGLLALLAEAPRGVYQLRKDFEERTGGTWPVNIGQVYTTVQRLERDGLVAGVDDGSDLERFVLTDAGRTELRAWWAGPVDRSAPGREELVIKLALAVAAPDVDVPALVQRQRSETMRVLRDYTRLKRGARGEGELAWSLVLDHLIFTAEAEMRWLDHVESAVVRAASTPTATSATLTGTRAAAPVSMPPGTGTTTASPGRGGR